MLQLLQAVALGDVKVTPLQLRAAIAAAKYTHAKLRAKRRKVSRAQAD